MATPNPMAAGELVLPSGWGSSGSTEAGRPGSTGVGRPGSTETGGPASTASCPGVVGTVDGGVAPRPSVVLVGPCVVEELAGSGSGSGVGSAGAGKGTVVYAFRLSVVRG